MPHVLNRFLLSVLICTLCLLTSQCHKKHSSNSVNTPQVVELSALEKKGKLVFESNCASCHGLQGMGDGPASAHFNPRNFKKDTFKQGSDVESVQKTIFDGIPGTVMVAWKDVLPREDIEAVAHYVLHLKDN